MGEGRQGLSLRVLLVNPWIVDVAAFNFWLRPLGLYRLAEWLGERGALSELVDCLSPFPAPGKFPFERLPPGKSDLPKGLKRYGISPDDFRRRVVAMGKFDAVLLTSALSYWHLGAREAIALLREVLPGTPIYLGGVYPTLWFDHATATSGADRVFSGSLEECGGQLATTLGLPQSPVSAGKPWWELSLHDGADYAAVRTARGCPYSCSYCASRLVGGRFNPRDAADLARELIALRGLGVRQIAFYDDALLVGARERLFPAIDRARELGARFVFHTPNGLHANLVDGEVGRRMVESGFASFRLAFETIDPARRRETGGKVEEHELVTAVRSLLDAGADPASIGVYLMMGLPGQPPAEVEESIRFVRSLGVRPYLSEFSPIPSTPEWGKAVALGFVSEGDDPLWTDNSIYLTRRAGWEEEAVRRLKIMAREPLGVCG